MDDEGPGSGAAVPVVGLPWVGTVLDLVLVGVTDGLVGVGVGGGVSVGVGVGVGVGVAVGVGVEVGVGKLTEGARITIDRHSERLLLASRADT